MTQQTLVPMWTLFWENTSLCKINRLGCSRTLSSLKRFHSHRRKFHEWNFVQQNLSPNLNHVKHVVFSYTKFSLLSEGDIVIDLEDSLQWFYLVYWSSLKYKECSSFTVSSLSFVLIQEIIIICSRLLASYTCLWSNRSTEIKST